MWKEGSICLAPWEWLSDATFQNCRDSLFSQGKKVESEPLHLCEFIVCSPLSWASCPLISVFVLLEGWQGCMAITHSYSAFVWGKKTHPFFWVDTASPQVYGVLNGVLGWISALVLPLLTLLGELTLLYIAARAGAWYLFRVMSSNACVDVCLSFNTCYPNDYCCKCRISLWFQLEQETLTGRESSALDFKSGNWSHPLPYLHLVLSDTGHPVIKASSLT